MARKCDLSSKFEKTDLFLSVPQREGDTKLVYLVNNLVKNIHLSLIIVPNIYSIQALVLDVFILIIMFSYISRCSMTGCFSQ